MYYIHRSSIDDGPSDECLRPVGRYDDAYKDIVTGRILFFQQQGEGGTYC